eukprot:Gb_19653 [translate_table: standard]
MYLLMLDGLGFSFLIAWSTFLALEPFMCILIVSDLLLFAPDRYQPFLPAGFDKASAPEDVAKFCSALSELYSYTFKPVLDVVLFTQSLAKTIGYKGQFVLYGYFLLSSTFLRAISPPLALLTAQEAALSGNFRNAHQRYIDFWMVILTLQTGYIIIDLNWSLLLFYYYINLALSAPIIAKVMNLWIV